MKELDLSDHRAVRKYLTADDYGLHEGDEYAPKGVISPESWASLTNLPDTVALMTTDGYSGAIGTMQQMVSAWLDIHDAMPEGSPMRSQSLDAYECFEGAIFNAVHGWYRLAGIAIRNAVEDVVIGFYYQHQSEKADEFTAVTTGRARTPRRVIVDSVLQHHGAPPELLREVNTLYNDELSIYVHRMSDGELPSVSTLPEAI